MQTEKNETTPPCAAIEPAARGVRVINTPGVVALKLIHHWDDLPSLTARIEYRGDDGDGHDEHEVTIYWGSSVIATMKVFRGRAFAIRTARAALKGAMSRLGKHRRWTANRAACNAAANEEECK